MTALGKVLTISLTWLLALGIGGILFGLALGQDDGIVSIGGVLLGGVAAMVSWFVWREM